METMLARCAGLDVHQETVEATVRVLEGDRARQQTRRWGTMTREILAMADWLEAQGVTHGARESTGVYGKPIDNILESQFTVMRVKARHLKPGRKSDVRDSQWIAPRWPCGRLRGSFIPPRPQREWRDLTRHRAQWVGEQTRVVNRIHQTLEDAHIQLGSVATDILGVSGRAMIHALMEGEVDAGKLAAMARGQWREKRSELPCAREGRVTDHPRFRLRLLGKELAGLEELIAELERKIEEVTRPLAPLIERMDPVPGVDRHLAEVVLAEVGADLSPCATHQHLACWTGMSPSNEESAGKRRTGRTPKGNRWLRAALVQAAGAASHSKNSYLAAQYHRLVGRRGKKRALVAVGHSILVIIYHLLKSGSAYSDLGRDFFDRLNHDPLTRYHLKRLEDLGHKVTLQPTA